MFVTINNQFALSIFLFIIYLFILVLSYNFLYNKNGLCEIYGISHELEFSSFTKYFLFMYIL